MPQQKRIESEENPSTRMAPRIAQSQAPVDPPEVEPLEERIRRRAYEIFLSRGGPPGDPVADWLQAERELRERGESSL